MSNKVEKLETTITVLCGREELVKRFPKMNTTSSMQIYHNNQQVHIEDRPSGDLSKVLTVLKKHIPTISFLVTKYEQASDYYIRIGDTQYDIWNHSDKDKARLEITSYESSLDKHYEKVDRLKEKLMRRGVQIESGMCEVTTKTRC